MVVLQSVPIGPCCRRNVRRGRRGVRLVTTNAGSGAIPVGARGAGRGLRHTVCRMNGRARNAWRSGDRTASYRGPACSRNNHGIRLRRRDAHGWPLRRRVYGEVPPQASADGAPTALSVASQATKRRYRMSIEDCCASTVLHTDRIRGKAIADRDDRPQMKLLARTRSGTGNRADGETVSRRGTAYPQTRVAISAVSPTRAKSVASRRLPTPAKAVPVVPVSATEGRPSPRIR